MPHSSLSKPTKNRARSQLLERATRWWIRQSMKDPPELRFAGTPGDHSEAFFIERRGEDGIYRQFMGPSLDPLVLILYAYEKRAKWGLSNQNEDPEESPKTEVSATPNTLQATPRGAT